MSIEEELGPKTSITEGNRALELFTDRVFERRLFASYLNDDPSPNKILFFYGDGGNGKSLLLRLLREKYCRRLSQSSWDYVKELEVDQQFVQNYENSVEADSVPYVYLDFGTPDRGDDRPRQDYAALLMLRRGLAEWRISLPLFDFAIVVYLIKARKFSKERLKEIVPKDEFDLFSRLIDAYTEKGIGSVISAFINLINSNLNEKFTLYMQKRGLNESEVNRIERMEADPVLFSELPKLFAEDLNTVMQMTGAPKRIVLFFDTHDAFWGSDRVQQSKHIEFAQDEWLRCLLRCLHLNCGIVAVIAGKVIPSWPDTLQFPIPIVYIDTHLIGCLRKVDAEEYLAKAGINDPAIVAALIHYTEAERDQVHPLYLGLCADIVITAFQKGNKIRSSDFQTETDFADKSRILLLRLLSYCSKDMAYAVKALAAARAFDQKLFFNLAKEMNYQATSATFDILTEFSFVKQQTKTGGLQYRIHNTLRNVLWRLADRETLRAHKALTRYFLERYSAGEELAIVEVIYHTNRIQWKPGFKIWTTAMEEALTYSKLTLSEALLGLKPELILEKEEELGQFHFYSARFNTMLARYLPAQQDYVEALRYFDEALNRSPKHYEAQLFKGRAQHRWAMLLTELGKHQEALVKYDAAVKSFNQEINFTSEIEKINLYLSKGHAQQSWADLVSEVGDPQEAMKLYANAVDTSVQALKISPTTAEAFINKGFAQQGWAMLLTELGKHQEALVKYDAAVKSYDQAICINKVHPFAHNNKGYVQHRWAELLTVLGDQTNAMNLYAAAVASCDQALKIAPNSTNAINNKGLVQMGWANLLGQIGQHQEALDKYSAAVASLNQVLQHAPESVKAYGNIGIAEMRWAKLLAELGKLDEAREMYLKAIASYDQALEITQDQFSIITNKGIALTDFADLLATLKEHPQAELKYQEAIVCFDEALKIAPNYDPTKEYKELTLEKFTLLK